LRILVNIPEAVKTGGFSVPAVLKATVESVTALADTAFIRGEEDGKTITLTLSSGNFVQSAVIVSNFVETAKNDILNARAVAVSNPGEANNVFSPIQNQYIQVQETGQSPRPLKKDGKYVENFSKETYEQIFTDLTVNNLLPNALFVVPDNSVPEHLYNTVIVDSPQMKGTPVKKKVITKELETLHNALQAIRDENGAFENSGDLNSFTGKTDKQNIPLDTKIIDLINEYYRPEDIFAAGYGTKKETFDHEIEKAQREYTNKKREEYIQKNGTVTQYITRVETGHLTKEQISKQPLAFLSKIVEDNFKLTKDGFAAVSVDLMKQSASAYIVGGTKHLGEKGTFETLNEKMVPYTNAKLLGLNYTGFTFDPNTGDMLAAGKLIYTSNDTKQKYIESEQTVAFKIPLGIYNEYLQKIADTPDLTGSLKLSLL
jgi:hypothetical protein